MPNTVFVIGAGASKEANLPTGYELKTIISDLLDIRFQDSYSPTGDLSIINALREYVNTNPDKGVFNSYLYKAWQIRDALPLAISIDNFLDAHKDDEKIELCGKLSIVSSIVQAERKSLLYIENKQDNLNNIFKDLEQTWYVPFFQLLTKGCGKEKLKDRFSLVTLIIFNYDRCIEHFLLNALKTYYLLPEKEAAAIVNGMKIYHPYGSVAPLPWQHANSDAIGYGEDIINFPLLRYVPKIKTFTEGTHTNSSDIQEIKEKIAYATRLVFLGFAFHELNMTLIKPSSSKISKKCYASAFKISKSGIEEVKCQLQLLSPGQIDKADIHIEANSCKVFFDEFERSLRF